MRPNRLRAMHRDGKKAVNGWLGIPSGFSAEVMAHAGYHSLTIDCQHGMSDFGMVLAMLQAISTTDVVPLVRPSQNDPAEIMRLLDAGAYGVICPMISTREEAERLVQACRYPPVGNRSFGPSRAALYGGADYFTGANDEILVFGMIETQEALDNLDAIVTTPGLDGIYVGPNDLSLALGQPPKSEPDHPDVVAAIERIRATTVAAKRIAGVFCSSGEAARARFQEGFDLATPGNDGGLLRSAAASAIQIALG